MTRYLFVSILILFAVSSYAAVNRTLDGQFISNGAATLTLPSSTDTITGRATTDTLSNKTISGASNTLSNLPVDSQYIREVPTGTVNGTNDTFTLSQTPPSGNSLVVSIDGIVQRITTDYTISGSTLTMVAPPEVGQSVYVIYSRY